MKQTKKKTTCEDCIIKLYDDYDGQVSLIETLEAEAATLTATIAETTGLISNGLGGAAHPVAEVVAKSLTALNSVNAQHVAGNSQATAAISNITSSLQMLLSSLSEPEAPVVLSPPPQRVPV